MSSVTRDRRVPDHDTTVCSDEQLTVLALAAREGAPADVEAFTRAVYPDVRRFVAYLAGDPVGRGPDPGDVRARPAQPAPLRRPLLGPDLAAVHRPACRHRPVPIGVLPPRVAELADWQAAAERCQPRGLPGREDGVALADLLARVPRERREAFVLTQVVGLPYAEAALLIGCPIGTVRSRVARARTQLIESLHAADRAA